MFLFIFLLLMLHSLFFKVCEKKGLAKRWEAEDQKQNALHTRLGRSWCCTHRSTTTEKEKEKEETNSDRGKKVWSKKKKNNKRNSFRIFQVFFCLAWPAFVGHPFRTHLHKLRLAFDAATMTRNPSPVHSLLAHGAPFSYSFFSFFSYFSSS